MTIVNGYQSQVPHSLNNQVKSACLSSEVDYGSFKMYRTMFSESPSNALSSKQGLMDLFSDRICTILLSNI